ncbi:MAG: glycosyltransferase involved in cell wall biosynthesis [Pseudohongiellaceae bacterium]|jgi:glycosyltransferase involved in cell wall biosynthesis
MKRVMLVPAETERIREEFERGDHPRVDFLEMAREMDADIVSWSHLGAAAFWVRLARTLLGRNIALALLGFSRHADSYFVTAESVSLPLSALLLLSGRRPGHVLIGHRISAPKKARLMKLFGLCKAMTDIVTYSRDQIDFGQRQLGFARRKLHRIHFQIDPDFFRPDPGVDREAQHIVAVGRERRDYPTLIEAVRGMNVELTIVGSSPWSRSKDLTDDMDLPANVTLRSGLSWLELRRLYSSAALAVVPLQDVDSAAGVTSIFEALATGTPVLVSDTSGIAESIENVPGVLRVPPGDRRALTDAIDGALADSEALAIQALEGREVVKESRSLDVFVERVQGIVANAEAECLA